MSTTNARRAIIFSQYGWLTGGEIVSTIGTSTDSTRDCFDAMSERIGIPIDADGRDRIGKLLAEYIAPSIQRLEVAVNSAFSSIADGKDGTVQLFGSGVTSHRALGRKHRVLPRSQAEQEIDLQGGSDTDTEQTRAQAVVEDDP